MNKLKIGFLFIIISLLISPAFAAKAYKGSLIKRAYSQIKYGSISMFKIPGVTSLTQEKIDWARLEKSKRKYNKVLLETAKHVDKQLDIFAIAVVIAEDSPKALQIVEALCKRPIFSKFTIDDICIFSQYFSVGKLNNHLLIEAAKKIAKTPKDFKLLQSRVFSKSELGFSAEVVSFIQSNIRSIGRKKMKFNQYHNQ